MTKTVRVENADNSTFIPVIEVQDKVMVYDEDTKEWMFTGEWKTVETIRLGCPTAMASPYITSSRRLIVREEEPTKNA